VTSPEADRVDIVVIGAGIVGLAAATAVHAREPDARICVVDKEGELALHQTGRNSGVVHAGIYYVPGSMKAQFCAAGRIALKLYTTERGIAYDECGKLIVARTESELPALHELFRRATANEVPQVRMLDARGLRDVEPNASGVAALHSPLTAITDYVAICKAFAADVEKSGNRVLTRFAVCGISQDADSVMVVARDGRRLVAKRVLVCAGLYGDRVARLAGDIADPRIIPFRGDYFTLAPAKADRIRGLIYPVPDPAFPFLGVHLTRTVHGEVLVGPNAILATAREGYRLSTVQWREFGGTLGWPGFWRFGRRYWRVGVSELRRSLSKKMFAAEAASFVAGINATDLARTRAGVRAQALDVGGNAVDDFVITRVGRVVNVRNAPSPAATSSLPIGEALASALLS
jgi:(S)-2-hydroxyglutarate dehydrogenase